MMGRPPNNRQVMRHTLCAPHSHWSELLVVITIIVILLSLLAPALDEAVYQAELVLCASKLDATALGITGYALDHGRRYPRREAYRNGYGYARPNSSPTRASILTA